MNYEKMTIDQIEKDIEANISMTKEAQKLTVEGLLYLKTSNRFKENKRYAKSSFYDYISDRFAISTAQWMKMQIPFAKFPEETMEFGPGIVNRAIAKCGNIKAKKVMNDLMTAKEKGTLKRSRIIQMIDDNAKPEIKKAYTDWRAMYEAEVHAHEKTKAELKAALEEIDRLEDQIAKLKPTAQRFSEMRQIFERPVEVRV